MFDFFKRQRPKQTDPSSDLAKVVERMFLEYGVTHTGAGTCLKSFRRQRR